MAKKRQNRDPFRYLDNFFTDDANITNLFNILVREIFSNMDETDMNSPLAYGINMKIDKNWEREPLVDVIDKKKEVVVIAEVPGVEKGDIRITAGASNIEILAKSSDQERSYFKRVSLPRKVLPKTGIASYTNGVIEINVKIGSKANGEEIIKIN